MIKLQVIGHLGRDANVNTVNGKTVINFSVAHTESFKDAQGNKHDRTTWVSCSFWTERTAIAPYLSKGTQVYVEGVPSVNIFQNQQGQSQPELKLRVASVKLLGKKDAGGNSGSAQGYAGAPPSASDITEPIDDLPF